MRTFTILGLGLCAALAAGCATTSVAVNATTSEIYVVKDGKLKVCTLGEQKLVCDRSYELPE